MTISKELEATLQHAISEARRRRHEYLTVEHLLLALLADPVASRILQALGVNLHKVAEGLELFFREHIEPLPGDDEVEPKQTPAFWRVLQRAAMHVTGSGKDAMDGGNVLVALFREPDSHAVALLRAQGVGRLELLRFIAHGVTPEKETPAQPELEGDVDEEAGGAERDPLESYTVNLIAKAERGGIDPLIGRAAELERMIQVLCRRRKNNPVLVGDPGVGKTAIVEGLAKAIHEQRVPEILRGATVYALDMGAVLAGTKFRGQFEERLKNVIKAIQKDKKAILFIDEIHTIVGAGATSGGSMDASNLLKPALAAGELRCIGSTTFQEYKSSFERDRALGRRFQKIEVVEPSVEDTIEILRGLRRYYEEHHQVTYADDAVTAAAQLSARYVNDRYLPDKAIDVLDEAGSAARLKSTPGEKPTLGAHEIEAVVAKMAKIPEKTVSVSDVAALERLEPELRKVIYGQDQAIDALVAAIKLSRAGLGPAERPIGSFLFSGPTGVGKTELARQLARVMAVEFLRFDMS